MLMDFFHRTTCTRFWLRLRRHSSGHHEAVLSGLTCQDVYDELKEEFQGKHLVLFSRPGMIWDGAIFSEMLGVDYGTVQQGTRNPVYVLPPESVEPVLHAEPMNENDQWWFFPYPRPISVEEVRALGLRPELRWFMDKPHEGLRFFVASVQDLTVFTMNREHVLRLIQKMFRKYAMGVGLLDEREANSIDFVKQMELDLEPLSHTGIESEAHFRFLADVGPRIVKDTPREWRRVIYEYTPDTGHFEQRDSRPLNLLTLLMENWGAIAVWLSSGILLIGTVIIILCMLGLLLAFVLSFIL